MGLFRFLRRKDEQAIPEPGSPEFEAAVRGSAIPDSQSVDMGQPGWTSTSQTIDLRGSGHRARVEEVLRRYGIDPDQPGQTIDASKTPGLQTALLSVLMGAGLRIPNAEGFGGGISAPKQDPLAVVEQLAKQRDAGEITEAEFEAQKRRLLGE
jgi:hypothetical protein